MASMEDSSLTTFAAEALDHIFANIKGRLQEITQSHVDHADGDRFYTASNIELGALVNDFSNCIGRLQQKSQATSSTPSGSSAMLISSHLTASTAVDPVTTISIPEASFSPTADGQLHDAPSSHQSTATIVSGDSVTEIT